MTPHELDTCDEEKIVYAASAMAPTEILAHQDGPPYEQCVAVAEETALKAKAEALRVNALRDVRAINVAIAIAALDSNPEVAKTLEATMRAIQIH